MSLTEKILEALRKMLTLDARVGGLSASVEKVSRDLENHAAIATARLGEHAERLARLEGKFELLQTSLSSRRKRVPR